MSNLLKIEKDKIIPSPFLLSIPEFRKIWDRDKTKDKEKALLDLAYVYYISDYKSEYITEGANKASAIGGDLYNNTLFIPDEDMVKAIARYKLLQRTPSMLVLESTRQALDSIIYFFNSLRIQESDSDAVKKEKLANASKEAKDILGMIRQIEPSMNLLDSLDKRIYKELIEDGAKIQGGGEIGLFEDPEEYKREYGDKK